MKTPKLKRRYTQICKECGQNFLITKYWIKRKTKVFCSKKCVGLWRSKNLIGTKTTNYKPTFWTCNFCGIIKEVTATWADLHKFCSKECKKNFFNITKEIGNPLKNHRLVKFSSYDKNLSYADPIRRSLKIPGLLEVTCTYCGKWFLPNKAEVTNRISALNGKLSYGWGESRFYCSDGCKKACPSFNQKKYLKGFQPITSREVQPELRKLVFKRDDWTCQKCGAKENLHCHHFTGVELNPIESADMDNCITLCEGCHEEVHSEPGCFYSGFRRKNCKKNSFPDFEEKYYN